MPCRFDFYLLRALSCLVVEVLFLLINFDGLQEGLIYFSYLPNHLIHGDEGVLFVVFEKMIVFSVELVEVGEVFSEIDVHCLSVVLNVIAGDIQFLKRFFIGDAVELIHFNYQIVFYVELLKIGELLDAA